MPPSRQNYYWDSNIREAQERLNFVVSALPGAVARGVAVNANFIKGLAIEEIDALIYSTPQGTYRRTGHLRRSHHARAVAPLTWVLSNDADYAQRVHDGDSRMPPRPWLYNAVVNSYAVTEHLIRLQVDAVLQSLK